MVAITKRLIDTTQPGRKDGFLWDDDVRGFGLKITPGGRRIFILQYEWRAAVRLTATPLASTAA